MSNKPKFDLTHVEEALKSSAGIVSAAARLLEAAYGSCTPTTVRNYIKRYPRVAAVVAETIELNLDLAESNLLGLIRDKNIAAIIFYLKTKGRARGYIERIEASGPDGGPIQAQATVVLLPHNGRDPPRTPIQPEAAWRDGEK